MSIPFENIKLVIWDLDQTFWEGVLSEGPVQLIEKNIRTVRKLTDAGIINSICSKNDEKTVLAQLKKAGIRELFVFLSVNWEPKGQRIREMLSDMGLRAQNTLFLDDEALNREEAAFYNPGLFTGGMEELAQLADYAEHITAKDSEHSRLKQYQILEVKREARKDSGSNEEFLRKSNIRVEIGTDCMEHLDRIWELVKRTNQLNYTKLRSTREELQALIENPEYDCGYVSVTDKFGAYGIVGFYAKKERQLVHFLFSCRTLGMEVEQYVYAKLGYPEYQLSGEVAVKLRKEGCPDWINQEHFEAEYEGKQQLGYQGEKHKVLLKGPCDLNAIFSFIEPGEAIDCEFTYVSQETGVTIEQVNHTTHIVEAYTLSKEQKERVARELPFGDIDMYSDLIYRYPYDIVFISILQDVNMGLYRRKGTGELVAYAQGYYPLTDEKNRDAYIEGSIYTAQCKLTGEFLKEFSENYEFAGVLSPEQTVENIRKIREYLNPDTHLVIMLGTETEYAKNTNPAWAGKNLVYRELNERIRKLCKEQDHMDYIDVNHYIRGQESFYDHYNHFVVPVYYEMSKDIVRMIEQKTSHVVESKPGTYVWKRRMKELVRKGLETLGCKEFVRKGLKALGLKK